jgi:hypothetical protein
MPKAMRPRLWVSAGFIVAAASVIGFLSWLGVRGRPIVQTANISANGVYEAMYVPIGGIDQWVQIRGVDRNSPVLLWLNGRSRFLDYPGNARVWRMGEALHASNVGSAW